MLENLAQTLLEVETLDGKALGEVLEPVRQRPSRAAEAPDGMTPAKVIELLRRSDPHTNGSNGHGTNGNGSTRAKSTSKKSTSGRSSTAKKSTKKSTSKKSTSRRSSSS